MLDRFIVAIICNVFIVCIEAKIVEYFINVNEHVLLTMFLGFICACISAVIAMKMMYGRDFSILRDLNILFKKGGG